MTEGKRWLVVSTLVILVIGQTVTGYCLARTNQQLDDQYFVLDRALSSQQVSTSQEFRDVERGIEGLEQKMVAIVRSAQEGTRVHIDSELDRHYTKVELDFKLGKLEDRLIDCIREYRR